MIKDTGQKSLPQKQCLTPFFYQREQYLKQLLPLAQGKTSLNLANNAGTGVFDIPLRLSAPVLKTYTSIPHQNSQLNSFLLPFFWSVKPGWYGNAKYLPRRFHGLIPCFSYTFCSSRRCFISSTESPWFSMSRKS